MMRSIALSVSVVISIACGPPGQVLLEGFDSNNQFLHTQPAGDRAYWISGSEVRAIRPDTRNANEEVVASGLGSPARLSLLVDDQYVFTIDETTGQLVRTTRDGTHASLGAHCAAFPLHDDGAELICVAASSVIGDISFLSISKQTGAVIRTIPVYYALTQLTSSDTHVYFAGKNVLVSVDKATGTATNLVGADAVVAMEYLDGTLYWLEQLASDVGKMSLMSFDFTGTTANERVRTGNGGGLAKRGDTLYFGIGGKSIHRFDPATDKMVEVARVSQIYSFSVTDSHVVVSEDGRLLSFPR